MLLGDARQRDAACEDIPHLLAERQWVLGSRMKRNPRQGTIDRDGWRLVSAEERHAAHPQTFQIPSRGARESLAPGDGVRLLFEIETRERDRVIDRGVDRLWVIVKQRHGEGYVGLLDSDPGLAEGLDLRPGDAIAFGPEHVADIDRPPREYVLNKYGSGFFDE
jgi:hypothetical protein